MSETDNTVQEPEAEQKKAVKQPKRKDPTVELDQLVAFVQELAHFTGQERLLAKYGIPKMQDAHKVDYKKK